MSERDPKLPAPFSPLYPIVDRGLESQASMVSSIRALGRAGCRLVQLRGKDLSSKELHASAAAALSAARECGVRLVINDRPDVALLVGADGVHLGQDDLSPEAAREILGDSAIIGLSTHSPEEALRAAEQPVSYVAIGPVFETRTKSSGYPPLGVEGVREVRARVRQPLVAIGGVTLSRTRELIEAGADGVAVVSALRRGAAEGRSLEIVAREWLAAARL